MSSGRRPEDDALDRLEEIRDGAVPDPGNAYWQAFPARLQARLDIAPAPRRRAWRRWVGLAGDGAGLGSDAAHPPGPGAALSGATGESTLTT